MSLEMTGEPTRTASARPAEDVRLALYKQMVEVRRFETRIGNLYLQGETQGPCHLALGQEAIAAGFGTAMRSDDLSYATHRSHAHTLCRGVPMEPVMAELLGRGTGLLKGKGGSMHLTSVEHGLMGCNAIVGAHLPIAAGAAWASQLRGSDQVTVCFFGDGATNIGAFHESMNMAAVWKLPVIYVCENNQYMEYSPIGSVTAVEHPAADRAASYGLPRIVIDGNDPDEVYAAAREYLARCRAGEGPVLVEAMTYRHRGHSMADPAKYRDQEEVARWMEQDPVPSYRDRLLSDGVAEHVLDEIDEAAVAAVQVAVDYAKQSPRPALETLTTDVWADGGSTWHN